MFTASFVVVAAVALAGWVVLVARTIRRDRAARLARWDAARLARIAANDRALAARSAFSAPASVTPVNVSPFLPITGNRIVTTDTNGKLGLWCLEPIPAGAWYHPVGLTINA